MLSELTKSVSTQLNRLLFSRSGGLSVTPPLRETDLVPFMERSVYDWPFPPDLEQEKQQKINNARRSLQDGQVPKDFPSLLNLLIDSRQMDWMIDKCLVHNHPLVIEQDCARKLVIHQRELLHSKPRSLLHLSVDIVLKELSIPDDTTELIEVDLILVSGADIDELLDFMVLNNMLEDSDKLDTKDRWESSGDLVGYNNQEQRALDKCLSIRLLNTIGRHVHREAYNFGFDSRFIWRIAHETVQMRTRFDLSQYPFDKHTISSFLSVPANNDPSELALYPDSTDPYPLDTRLTIPPRGFHLNWISDKLEPLATYTSAAWTPLAYLRFAMSITRSAQPFIWRTLIPSLVIVSLGFFATAFAVLTHQYIESVMTQVIPATLIACVAMQLTASQAIPSGAGRTKTDALFIAYYVHIFLLYVVLQFTPSILSWCLLGIALAILVFCIGYYYGQAWHSRNPLPVERN